MSEPKFTKGPYLRVDTTVYALQHAGWRKGEEQFCNRIYANVQRGPDCSIEEAEAVARLFQAAPDLLEAVQAMIEWDARETDYAVDFNARLDLCHKAFEKARAALAKALGEPQ